MFDSASIRFETVAYDASIDLLSVLRLRRGAELFYWEHPESGVTIAALGAVARFEADGPGRFDEVSKSARRALHALMQRSNHAAEGHGPMVVGGFGFSDRPCAAHEWREFPPLRMVLPELLWVRRGARCTLTRILSKDREPRCDIPPGGVTAAHRSYARSRRPPPYAERRGDDQRSQWCARVERVRAQIIAGDLRKVVLSRRIKIETARPFDPALILETARRSRSSCFNFWLSGAATSFVGSTPERLVRIDRGQVVSGALAGSAPRGATEAEDQRLGRQLLASSKNREEHELVVGAVRSALAAVTAPISEPAEPSLMRLPEAQHLFTPIQGRLCGNRSVLEIAGLLHPTPAVCGAPRAVARAIIEREEPGRGWYTGAVGWMDGCGN
ncbi:MAG TPA: isochorismate synthase, partial [Candidatus Binataceae bacterium]|nr:isochorismate synthase [Candidatus Binataceae bacterium]